MTKAKTKAADLLTEVGRCLYGEDWINPMARALGMKDRSLRSMLTGKIKLTFDHGAVKDALRLLKSHRDDLERRRDVADRIIARMSKPGL